VKEKRRVMEMKEFPWTEIRKTTDKAGIGRNQEPSLRFVLVIQIEMLSRYLDTRSLDFKG